MRTIRKLISDINLMADVRNHPQFRPHMYRTNRDRGVFQQNHTHQQRICPLLRGICPPLGGGDEEPCMHEHVHD